MIVQMFISDDSPPSTRLHCLGTLLLSLPVLFFSFCLALYILSCSLLLLITFRLYVTLYFAYEHCVLPSSSQTVHLHTTHLSAKLMGMLWLHSAWLACMHVRHSAWKMKNGCWRELRHKGGYCCFGWAPYAPWECYMGLWILCVSKLAKCPLICMADLAGGQVAWLCHRPCAFWCCISLHDARRSRNPKFKLHVACKMSTARNSLVILKCAGASVVVSIEVAIYPKCDVQIDSQK